MADLMNTAVRGLLAYQRALATTGHNIANVATDGFSRQTVEINTQKPTGAVGAGVGKVNIRREVDMFIVEQLRIDQSELNRLNGFHELASLVDDVLADSKGGISSSLQNFFNSLQDVSNDPASMASRVEFLSKGEELVNRFKTIDSRLNDFNNLVGKQIEII